MQRLVIDPFVRRACQGILLGLLALSAIVSIAAAILLWWRADYGLEGWASDLGIGLFQFLSLPYKETLAPLAVVFTTAIPVVFSSVCFKLNGATPPALTSELNKTGHIAFGLTVAGMICGAICLLALQVYSDAAISLSSDDPATKTATQGIISTLVAFHAVYFLQLLGLQPK